MDIEYIKTEKNGHLEGVAAQRAFGSTFGPFRTEIAKYMSGVRQGIHDRAVASVLCTASAWAYSDLDTFTRMMVERGFEGAEVVALTITNNALLVDTTAYLLQINGTDDEGNDKTLLVLCFRGTGIDNVIDWLTDISVSLDLFQTVGYVHGGFYRSLLMLWNPLQNLLRVGATGKSICEAALTEYARFATLNNRFPAFEDGQQRAKAAMQDDARRANTTPDTLSAGDPKSAEPPTPHDAEKQSVMLEGAMMGTHGLAKDYPGASDRGIQSEPERKLSFYITGHSLGGALAALAGALIHVQQPLDTLRRSLRGIYTFGQPMVGNAEFAMRCDEQFGDLLFRHVNRFDVVPCWPPRTTGKFAHFGRQLITTDQGWMFSDKKPRQAHTFSLSSMLGLLTFVQKQLSRVPILDKLPVYFSWFDHLPQEYLHVSRLGGREAEV